MLSCSECLAVAEIVSVTASINFLYSAYSLRSDEKERSEKSKTLDLCSSQSEDEVRKSGTEMLRLFC